MSIHWSMGTERNRVAARSQSVDCRAQAIGVTGFTITELLVVIAVISLLVGLVMTAMRGVRTAGAQTNELSAARQLMAAYHNYAAVHQDRVLPGYADRIPDDPADPSARIIRAFDARGNEIGGSGPLNEARKRWLWRLAPYFDYNLRGLYTNSNQDTLDRIEQEDYEWYLYKASVSPSLGLNSDWVGGDARHFGFEPLPKPSGDGSPPQPSLHDVLDLNHYYITALSQVRHPEDLIVFASARGVPDQNSAGPVVEGYFYIESPYFSELSGYRWESDRFHPGDPPDHYGYISPRYDGKAVTAFIDGHTDMLLAEQFKDMRHWANWATSSDWRLPRIDQ